MDIVIDKLTTIDELMRLSSKGRYELIEGVIHEMAPAGEEHGIIASNIIHLIRQFVKEHKSGVVTSSETGYKLSSAPDTVRAPDMAFKSRKRMAEGGITKGYSSVLSLIHI